MRIRVWHGYNGSGVIILKGEYEEDAPELFGLASYLVKNRHAEVIGGGRLEADAAEPQESTDPLATLSNADLRELATKRGLKTEARMNKATLLKVLRGEPLDDSDAGKAEGDDNPAV